MNATVDVVAMRWNDALASNAAAALKVILFANTDWYLFNFRLSLAHFLRARGMNVVLMCPNGPYVERLRAAGFRVVLIGMERRSLVPWAELAVIREIAAIYRRERPDIVHHFTIKCVIYGSIAAAVARVRARINAVAGLGFVFASRSLCALLLRPLVGALLRLSLRGRHARLIVQNSDDAELFRREGLIDSDNIRLIRGSGVNTRRFTPSGLPVRREVTTVLLASRLLWDKGIGEFVEAARICRSQGHEVRFLLAGAPDSGNPASVQQADVDRWRHEDLIEPLGQVADVCSLLQQVDIVALPTVYGEGVPRILIEAAACALPLIATRMPGCTEIVRHSETGLLIEPRDSGELAAAILELHARPDLRARMGAAARDLAVSEFDESLVLRRTIDVYAEVIELPEDASTFANASPPRLRAV